MVQGTTETASPVIGHPGTEVCDDEQNRVCRETNSFWDREAAKARIARWRAEASRHERAADAIHQRDTAISSMDEDQMLHLEIARVLRNCARELSEAL